MSPSTLDTIVPAIIFGSTLVGIIGFATAPDIQSAVMGLCIFAISIMICYFEFMRTMERANPSKID